MRALRHLRLHSLDHGRMRMAEQERAVAAEIVDILVAIDVPLAGALGPGDMDGIGIEIARIVRDAAGQNLVGTLEQDAGARRPGLVVGDDGGVCGRVGPLPNRQRSRR